MHIYSFKSDSIPSALLGDRNTVTNQEAYGAYLLMGEAHTFNKKKMSKINPE